MAEMTEYPDGVFCWVDLIAADLDAALRWYGEMFGWDNREAVAEGHGRYVMFSQGGKLVAGAGQMSEEMKAAGVPPSWNSYVSVSDAAATVAKARELGAEITVPVVQVPGSGALAFLTDPTGASVAIWQDGGHCGAGLVNEPVSLAWNELATRDVDGAKAFYGELFGWGFGSQDMGAFEYTTLKVGERDNGGILPMIGEHWQGIPPSWMVYFAVEDVDATAAKIEGAGGSIKVPGVDIPGVGRFAVVADPQGAVFTVISLISQNRTGA